MKVTHLIWATQHLLPVISPPWMAYCKALIKFRPNNFAFIWNVLSRKAITPSTPAILQIHDKFHGMDMRGEATCDDQSFLNDLQAHRFNCLVVKALKIVSTDPLIGVNSAPLQPGNSCGKHCYKWNKDSNNCTGCILYVTLHRSPPSSSSQLFQAP